YFLELKSLNTQFLFNPKAEAELDFPAGEDGISLATADLRLTLEYDYEEKPTISYAPLKGTDFVTRMLSPIGIDTILLILNVPRRVDKTLATTVRQINGLVNVPVVAKDQNLKEFQRSLELMQALRSQGLMRFGHLKKGKEAHAVVQFSQAALDTPEYQELTELLGIEPGKTEYNLVSGIGDRKPDTIMFNTRSLSNVLEFASIGVQIPEEDVKAGNVSMVRDSEGPISFTDDFANRKLKQNMQIRSSKSPPANPAVAVKYRRNWFYIDGADLNSKAIYYLIVTLFALKSGDAKGAGPILTLPLN
ncbi:MAG: hypothetical protein V3T76_08245, partial [candidate division NC10 bacterium]